MNRETPQLESKPSYKPFNPEAELKNLRKGDKETRAEKLEEYKKELIKQKEGVAEIQEDLEKQIRENPDLNQEELMKTVSAKAPEYKLSENQLALFKTTLNKYIERHQAVREARKQYPHDKELFKACFGKEPRGIIEVIERPVTLYFRCHDIKDYAHIYSGKFFVPQKKQKITRRDIKKAKMTGGQFLLKCLIPSLDNSVMIERAEKESSESDYDQQVFIHEEQHAINQLFKEQWLNNATGHIRRDLDAMLQDKTTREFINEEFQRTGSSKILSTYLNSEKESFENAAKDEILAYSKVKNISLVKAGEFLLRQKDESGLYDYFAKHKKEIETNLKEKLTPKIYRKNKKAIKNIFKQVFVDEYKKEIVEAIYAMKDLEEMGKSREDIVHLLITEPLNRWDKLVNRIKKYGSSR